MTSRLAASLIGAALALAGCTIRPQQATISSGRHVHLTDRELADNDANSLMYIDFYHPEAMIRMVEQCYHAIPVGEDRPFQTRGCLMLDYAAAKDWKRRNHQFHFTIPDYFSDEAQLQRFTQYGPQGNFPDPDTMYHVLHEMYYIMEQGAIQRQASSGMLCIPGSMPTIPPKNCLAYPFKIHRYHMGT